MLPSLIHDIFPRVIPVEITYRFLVVKKIHPLQRIEVELIHENSKLYNMSTYVFR